MRPGYRAFLMGTATDLPTRGFTLNRRKTANEIFASVRKWDKVVTSAEH